MATVRVERPSELGPALREVRLGEDITQSDLAALAGVGRQWLNAFETGNKPSAPLDMVMRVTAALGVSLNLAASPGSVANQAGQAEEVAETDLFDLGALLDEFS